MTPEQRAQAVQAFLDMYPGYSPFAHRLETEARWRTWLKAWDLATQAATAGVRVVPSRTVERMKFYSVDSVSALIDAQATHIERLQAKLKPAEDKFPRTPREG